MERTFDEIAAVNLDRFCRLPERAAERQEYIDRGLVPTNNLCMYFFESSQKELLPGIPNHYDYRYRPFGPVLEEFREAHSDLWEQAREVAEERSAVMQEVVALMDAKRKEIIQAPPAPVEVKGWRRVMSRVLNVSAPEQEETSIETFDFIGALPEEKRQAADETRWKEAEVYTRVFKILAPKLEAADINPIDVCV